MGNINETQMNSVALDEEHEMLISWETKACLTRITPNTLSKLAEYLPYRSGLLAKIKSKSFHAEPLSMNQLQTCHPCQC